MFNKANLGSTWGGRGSLGSDPALHGPGASVCRDESFQEIP